MEGQHMQNRTLSPFPKKGRLFFTVMHDVDDQALSQVRYGIGYKINEIILAPDTFDFTRKQLIEDNKNEGKNTNPIIG